MRTTIGLLAAAVAAVVFVGPAAAGWPGNNGHIIFGDPSGGTDYIWSVNPDGTGLTKIFSHGTEHATPGDISPDGTSLVVVDTSFSLSVISLPPSAPNEVVLDAHDNSSIFDDHVQWGQPSFSPDSTRVLWVRRFFPAGSSSPTDSQIFVTNRNGSGKTLLYESANADDPRWSPDGSSISFVDSGVTYTKAATAAGVARPTLLPFSTSPGLSPVSPDGRVLAFPVSGDPDVAPNTELYVSNVDGTNRVRLTNVTPIDQTISSKCEVSHPTIPCFDVANIRWQTVAPTLVLGTKTLEPGVDTNPDGTAEAFRVTATRTGVLGSVSTFLDLSSTASRVVVGIYGETANRPGALLAQSTITAPVAGAWNTVGLAAAVVAGQHYWLSLLTPRGHGAIKFRDLCCGYAGADQTETSQQRNLTAMPALWSTGRRFRDGPMSAYGW